MGLKSIDLHNMEEETGQGAEGAARSDSPRGRKWHGRAQTTGRSGLGVLAWEGRKGQGARPRRMPD
jgi:hypothetical protein